jgi:phosphoribosylpyrophosphate synthetase
MDKPNNSEFIILSGNSHPELANLVAGRLGMKLGNCDVYHKSNRETMVLNQ